MEIMAGGRGDAAFEQEEAPAWEGPSREEGSGRCHLFRGNSRIGMDVQRWRSPSPRAPAASLGGSADGMGRQVVPVLRDGMRMRMTNPLSHSQASRYLTRPRETEGGCEWRPQGRPPPPPSPVLFSPHLTRPLPCYAPPRPSREEFYPPHSMCGEPCFELVRGDVVAGSRRYPPPPPPPSQGCYGAPPYYVPASDHGSERPPLVFHPLAPSGTPASGLRYPYNDDQHHQHQHHQHGQEEEEEDDFMASGPEWNSYAAFQQRYLPKRRRRGGAGNRNNSSSRGGGARGGGAAAATAAATGARNPLALCDLSASSSSLSKNRKKVIGRDIRRRY